MLGPPKTRNLDRPVLISLEAYVPQDHFYRHLERTLNLAFVRDLVADCYASGGRPSIDPVVFFKLHLVMFFEGLRSERKLIEVASLSLAMRWYLGYNLDEPLPDWEHKTAYYGPAQFTYDAEHDVYVCPQGTLLHPYRRELKAEKVEYRADATICNVCPRKAECTPSDQGRQVHRSFHAAYLDRVRDYHETEDYQKAMRKRKVWVEPLFGEAKQWHGMRRFRLRGLMKVNIEGLFIAAGQNLKRLLSAKGWGRRPWPDGATGFAGILSSN